MISILPQSSEEAFDTFTKEAEDVPTDCHNHCDCYWDLGKCCDCGDLVEQKPTQPLKNFLEEQAERRPVHPIMIQGLSYDLDVI